jgi:hypothetical protein
MAFVKGQSGNPNGRKSGSQNKLTKSVKEAFEIAFERLGGAEGLVEWGQENRTEFYKIAQKLIPLHVDANVNGDINLRVTTQDDEAIIARYINKQKLLEGK